MPSAIGILSRAIMKRWDDVALEKDFTGGIWNDETPREKKLPYVIFAIPDGGSVEGRSVNSNDSSLRRRVQMTQVEFDIYERGRSAAGTLADNIIKHFDDKPLPVEDDDAGVLGVRYFNDYCLRQSETVYRWVIIFEIRYWVYERVSS